MNLIDNIKAINGGGIFEAYSEDALLLGGRVLKNEQDVGLTDRKVNYFYTRFDDRPLKIQKAEIQIKSCTPYEIASPKVLVLQFKEFDLNGIMYAALNVFNENYNRIRYEVNEVDIRKEIILKQETGEVKPMEGYRLVKISYTEYMPLDGCEDITCNGDAVIPITKDVKVYINNSLRYEPSCDTNLNLTLVDIYGDLINATFNGDEIVVSLPPKGLMPLQTGQTTSYATNDDGDLQRGRLTDFYTLPYNNPFGGNDRFTDEQGKQTFANKIVIDWSSWDGGTDVLGYIFSLYSSLITTQIWEDWMTNAPYDAKGFGDFYVANYQEASSMFNLEYAFNYSPLNIYAGFWTSSSNKIQPSTTAISYYQQTFEGLVRQDKTDAKRALLVRTFTVNGTTLS